MRRLIVIAAAGFLLNLLWEHAHSALYMSYQNGVITDFILFRAALFDAVVITLFSFPFLYFRCLENRHWILYLALVIFAVALETWALTTGRWVYADAMPIVPVLRIGLTPAIQLALLCFVSSWIATVVERRNSR